MQEKGHITSKDKANKIFDDWADLQGHYYDPVIIPRCDWSGPDNCWKDLVDMITKAIEDERE